MDWPAEWIAPAEDLVHEEFERSYVAVNDVTDTNHHDSDLEDANNAGSNAGLQTNPKKVHLLMFNYSMC